MQRAWQVWGLTLGIAAAGCKAAPKVPDLSNFAVDPAPGALHRLSQAEYFNSIHDLFSESIVVPPELEPDVSINGMVAIGMTTASLSPTGVSLYESAARSIATQAVSTSANQQAFIGCTPSGVSDQSCLKTFVTRFGKRAWRRPLQDAEVTELVQQGVNAAMATDDPWQGIGAAIIQILESPNFLYRIEVGEPDPSGKGLRYSNYEMASRIAAFLTASVPDDELLAAADRGELVTTDGLRTQVERILATPAARTGMRNFFVDIYALQGLKALNQDPTLFPAMNASLGPSALEETMEDLEGVIFDDNTDFRTFFTGRKSHVNRWLSAVYDIPAPSLSAFGTATFPANQLRTGFLGQTGFLALYAHPTTTSPTLRGKFVRELLLCDSVPPPPVNVNTGLEPVTDTVVTMRQRSQEHLKKGTTCSGCHILMDPIGLGLENFDAIGSFRTTDNGAPIDTSGDLDGVKFKNAVDLSQAIVDSPKFPKCFAREMFEYATGMAPTSGDTQLVTELGKAFVTTGYNVKQLMEITILSSGFRRAGAPQ